MCLAVPALLETGAKSHRDQLGGSISLFSVAPTAFRERCKGPCELRGKWQKVAGVLGRKNSLWGFESRCRRRKGQPPTTPTTPVPLPLSLQGEITFWFPHRIQGAGSKDREGVLPEAQCPFPQPLSLPGKEAPGRLRICLGSRLGITQKGQ